MLDAFLKVAYDHQSRNEESVKLSRVLRDLPIEDLRALADGTAKLAFPDCPTSDGGSDRTWLGKYKGTPLFDQALALEKSDLEAEVARTQAQAAAPPWDAMNKTQDQIRMQKKMLDLDLVELQNGGTPGLDAGPDQPMKVVPNEAPQGAGAMGDAGPDVEPMKAASVKEALLDTVLAGYLGHRKAEGAGEDTTDGALRGAGGYMLGGIPGRIGGRMAGQALGGTQGSAVGEVLGDVAGGVLGYKALTSKYDKKDEKHKKAAANFAQAALDIAKKNPKAVGAAVGAAGGAIAGGPDHRLSGAMGGAAVGAGAGGVAQRVGAGQTLGKAVANTGRAALNTGMRGVNRAANQLPANISSPATRFSQAANQLGHDAITRMGG